MEDSKEKDNSFFRPKQNVIFFYILYNRTNFRNRFDFFLILKRKRLLKKRNLIRINVIQS